MVTLGVIDSSADPTPCPSPKRRGGECHPAEAIRLSAIRLRPCGVWTPEVAAAPCTEKKENFRAFRFFGFFSVIVSLVRFARRRIQKDFRDFRGFSIHFRISPLPHLVLGKRKFSGFSVFRIFFGIKKKLVEGLFVNDKEKGKRGNLSISEKA